MKNTHTSDARRHLGWGSYFILTIQFDYTLMIRALEMETVSKVTVEGPPRRAGVSNLGEPCLLRC
jgi:hypothetical protein